MKSLGNSNTISSYTFNDEKPLATNYYRLKQIDNDGRYGYSKILLIKYTAQSGFSIMGNPVQNNLKVDIEFDPFQQTMLNVFDANGRKLITQKAVSQLQNINVSHLPAGQYVLSLVKADGSITTQVFQKLK